MKKILYFILVAVVIGIGCLHFFTPGHMSLYHDTYRRLSYFPIVLGAIWFGVRGGLSLAVLSSIAFIPHLLLYIGHGRESYISELMEVLLYLAAGIVTGIIAGRESRLREQYRLLSEKLEKSYQQLHDETALLLEVEEQLSASQKLSALGQLSASLAHEIKNPLSSIKGTAEILLDEFDEHHAKREFGEILIKEVNRLNETVNEVLKYSKGQVRAGNGATTEPLDQVISRVSRLLESHRRKKSIALDVKGLEQVKDFNVNGSKLSQVFLNIILNAIDWLPDNGRITLSCRRQEKGIEIQICDNGPGIIDEEKSKIFKPFYSGRQDGTGLGLSISAKIVESHGGSISVIDSESGGACFVIFLPPFSEYPRVEPLPDEVRKSK